MVVLLFWSVLDEPKACMTMFLSFDILELLLLSIDLGSLV